MISIPVTKSVVQEEDSTEETFALEIIGLDHSEQAIKQYIEELRNSVETHLLGGFLPILTLVRYDPYLLMKTRQVFSEHLFGSLWEDVWCWRSKPSTACEPG